MSIRKIYLIDDLFTEAESIRRFGSEHLPNLQVDGFVFDTSQPMRQQIESAVKEAIRGGYDLIILDVYFGNIGKPDTRLGIDYALPKLVDARLPVIVMSALKEREQLVANMLEANKRGRVRYLPSDQIESLLAYVQSMIEVKPEDDARMDRGFRYIRQDEIDKRGRIEKVFDTLARKFNSERLELPLVAPASNFLGMPPRPLSERDRGRLFTDVTRDAQAMAIRYEGTALAAKLVSFEYRNESRPDRFRYHYFQEMVRVEASTELDKRHFRAFYQAGIESFTDDSGERYKNVADIVDFSIKFLKGLGQEPTVRLSHVTLVPSLLDPLPLDRFQKRRAIGALEKEPDLDGVKSELTQCGIPDAEKTLLLELAGLRGSTLDAGIDFLKKHSEKYGEALAGVEALNDLLVKKNLGGYCRFDPGIYRSLDFYSGITMQGDVEGMKECLGGGEFTGLVESFGVLGPIYSFGMAAGVERLLNCVTQGTDERKSLDDAIDLVLSFRQSPLSVINASNLEKGLPPRHPLRSADELKSTKSAAQESDLKALDLLASRLDNINDEVVRKLPESLDSGADVRFEWRPIRRVGIYVPRRMPATAYTFLSAARASNVPEIVVYLAQLEDGNLDPLSVAAALRYGATVWGGPARYAFPALAFGLGTDDQPGCDLVCGPCGRNLNVLKHISCLLANVSTDMSAGPSTLTVVADNAANWPQLYYDLISQLEHGPDSLAELILIGKATREAWAKTPFSSQVRTRPEIKIYEVETTDEAAMLINETGPETVELWLERPEQAIPIINACGVLYVNRASSLGDYGAIGRGCADPTDSLAKSQSGLSPLTFLRLQAIVAEAPTSPELKSAASTLAAYEGLKDHQKAIKN